MTHFTLIPAHDYIKELTLSLRQAKKHVYIMGLILADDSTTHPLIEEIEYTAKRNIKINLAVDTFTYGELGGFFSPFKHQAAASRAVTAMTKRFIDAGVDFRWLGGNYKVNPFAGVTHIKWIIIDDIVYCFGGTNLYKKGLQSTDYMFKTTNKPLASILIKEHVSIIVADASPQSYAGYQKILPFGRLLIDSGKRRESLIYQRACILAKKADHISFVSQYCPSGELATYLLKKPADTYFNRPEQANFLNRLLIQSTMLKTGMKTSYQKSKYIHAKFMIFTMPDGREVALTGSHNFTYSGVQLGTREVALETDQPEIVTQLKSFLEQTIA